LIGQEEVVIKPLVDYLREDSGFSGATIVGDGRISLILDIYELVKMTSARQAERYREQSQKRMKKSRKITEKKAATQEVPAPTIN
jgi:two-component system chemotaxis sensor kinase CheA